MKTIAKWLATISVIIFVVAWGIMGLKILDNNHLFKTEAYVGLISLVVFFVCVLYMKLTSRCPHCRKTTHLFGKYCPYCGKEIN